MLGLRLQKICYSSQVLKSLRSDQKISEEELFIKSRQQSQRKDFYRDLMLKLDIRSTQAISIENYEIKFSIFYYTHILKYLCRVSFLTTLDIYKDYFKVRCACKCDTVHYSLWRSYCIFKPRVLWPRSFLIFIVDELKNFSTNYLL